MKKKTYVAMVLLVGALTLMNTTGGSAEAAGEILVGAIFPMTGPVALGGQNAKMAIDTAVDIINNKYDMDLPLARTEGLSRFGGAKVRVIYMDHQGSPEKGLSAAEKLIKQDRVVAIIGAFHSSVAAVISQQCERYRIPFIALESSSPSLSKRGLKWFFRTSPDDELLSRVMFDFMNDFRKKKGLKLSRIGLLHEDTLHGSDSARFQTHFAEKFGYEVVVDIKYRAKATSMVSEVEKLKSVNPDVLLPSSYINDAILIVKTMKELNYMPPMLIGQDVGWSDPELAREMGKDVEGMSSRNVFALDLAEKRPMVRAVNEMYKKKSKLNLTDNTSRELMGMIVVADAINRAGSRDPEAIQKALRETDIKPQQMILPWRGIRFDSDGQNNLANPILTQWYHGEMVTVWPFELAKTDAIYPLLKWSER
jgi:branched-chain amino acid transport system substrate-binding protein